MCSQGWETAFRFARGGAAHWGRPCVCAAACAGKTAAGRGPQAAAALGFAVREEIFLADRLAALGIRVLLATADGSLGTRAAL